MKYLTSENFSSEVENSNIPVVIDFYADWCGPCKMMAPIFDELSKDYNGKVNFMKLNTEKETDLAQSFDVMGIPTLLVMKDGKEIGRMVGFAPKPMLKAKIDAILAPIK